MPYLQIHGSNDEGKENEEEGNATEDEPETVQYSFDCGMQEFVDKYLPKEDSQ